MIACERVYGNNIVFVVSNVVVRRHFVFVIENEMVAWRDLDRWIWMKCFGFHDHDYYPKVRLWRGEK
ncbi:hypothetical protein HanRHA438_Chr13g0606971 [Helianthus annuus]|nr:hypothetical protein HanRHA438_Chr13g0606971 [Helianthus annuus]